MITLRREKLALIAANLRHQARFRADDTANLLDELAVMFGRATSCQLIEAVDNLQTKLVLEVEMGNDAFISTSPAHETARILTELAVAFNVNESNLYRAGKVRIMDAFGNPCGYWEIVR